ncbi:Dph6-related ATP pyrophosphatase [Sphingomonas oryzagri]
MTKVVMSWSGGKDSCVALDELLRSPDHEVVGLITTVTRDYDRISIHGVRRILLAQQAEALGLPLHEVFIPAECSNDAYEAAMAEALARYCEAGCITVAFGDLFLADIRAYRDALMARNGMATLYPVWGRDTRTFVERFEDTGFRAVISCVDLDRLDASFAGRFIDRALLADLPPGVDPCGENGEFHSFVFDGPCFTRPVPIVPGASVTRGRFCFRDLLPAA